MLPEKSNITDVPRIGKYNLCCQNKVILMMLRE